MILRTNGLGQMIECWFLRVRRLVIFEENCNIISLGSQFASAEQTLGGGFDFLDMPSPICTAIRHWLLHPAQNDSGLHGFDDKENTAAICRSFECTEECAE